MDNKMSCQERLIEIVEILYKNHVNGLTNREIARYLQHAEVTICRDMKVLERQHWTVRGSKSKWRLSPVFGKMGNFVRQAYDTAREQ